MPEDNPDTPNIDESQPAPEPVPADTVSNVEFVVTGKSVTMPMRVIELAAVKDGVTIPLVTMSVRAATALRDMLTTEIAFEAQLPPGAG